MTDTPTSNKRMRKQSLGSNVNTWGDTKLNEVLDVIDQCMDGYESIALTGSLVLATTNYTTSDQAKYRVINFTGAAGAVPVTFPTVQGWYLVLNNTNGVVTCLCASGVGVAIPAGYIALIYGDGTDMHNGAPQLFPGAITIAGQLHGVTAGTASTDATNVAQVSAAIAAATIPATSGTILNSINDTAAGYASLKITALTNGGLVRSTLNALGNEQNQFGIDFTNLIVTTNVAAADRFAIYDATAAAMRYQTRANVVGKYGLVLQASSSAISPIVAGNIYPLDCTAGTGTAVWPASAAVGDVFGLAIFGTGSWSMNTNSLNYYGSAFAAFAGTSEGVSFFFYSGATRGWIDA